MEKWIFRFPNTQRDRQTDRQTDGRTDRQTDRQTERDRERAYLPWTSNLYSLILYLVGQKVSLYFYVHERDLCGLQT